MSNAVTIVVNRTPITVAVSGAKAAGVSSHAALSGKNDEPDVQHLTAAQVALVESALQPGDDAGVSDVSDLTTTGWSAGDMPRVKAVGGGFEKRTPAQVLGDIGAARKIYIKTNNFIAVVGGRYMADRNTFIDITDPPTFVSPPPVLGDSYEVWVGGGTAGTGTVIFNGATPEYPASGTPIRRHFNGSTWASLITPPTPITSGGTGATTVAAAHVNLGAGTVGLPLYQAATVAAANAALAEVVKYKSGTVTAASTAYADVTGCTGFAVEANTWYECFVSCITTTAGTAGYNYQLLFTKENVGIDQVGPIGFSTFAASGISNAYYWGGALKAINLRGATAAYTNVAGAANLAFLSGPSAGTMSLQVANGTTGGHLCTVVNAMVKLKKMSI